MDPRVKTSHEIVEQKRNNSVLGLIKQAIARGLQLIDDVEYYWVILNKHIMNNHVSVFNAHYQLYTLQHNATKNCHHSLSVDHFVIGSRSIDITVVN